LDIDAAITEEQRHRASMLINERYAWRGYGSDFTLDHDPEQINLVATDQRLGGTVGTLTVGLDGPKGLLAEHVYPTEIQRLRDRGFRLCEITKFAIGHVRSYKPLLGKLFHVAFIHAHHLHGRSDLVIEVTPRHARFYQHLLHFEVAGAEKINPRVNTRGVLLRLDLNHAAEQIHRNGGQAEFSAEKTLYPYAMPPGDPRATFGHAVPRAAALPVAA
jgi:hypothetical protein